MSQRSRQRRDQRRRNRRLWRGGIAGVAIVVLLGTAVVARNGGNDEAGGSSDAATRVVMTEFAFDPDPIAIDAGDTVLELVNEGAVDHNLLVGELGRGSPSVTPGGSYELGLVDVEPGTYRVVCDLAGHTEAGMVTELIVR